MEARPYVIGREKTSLVTLTQRGRELLEQHRIERGNAVQQEFYSGVVKPRELAHDSQLYRAYVHAAERLRRGGSTVRRVALDYELKRDYQRFLRDLNRERRRAERDADAATRVGGMGSASRSSLSSTATFIFLTTNR